jgi:hypothetical protein
MHIRLGMMLFACSVFALAGCAEYRKPVPKRTLAYQAAPAAEQKKPVPLTTQSITPLPVPVPTLALEMSVEERLKAAWKDICGLRNIEHIEKGRINETEAQKQAIDEKCAEARWDSHMQ